jgi:ATP-dependent DNA helicase RecG
MKHKLSVLLKTIISEESKRTPDYKEITKLGSERTMERYIEQLKEVGFIEFKGTAAQTGGYFITEKIKKIISS